MRGCLADSEYSIKPSPSAAVVPHRGLAARLSASSVMSGRLELLGARVDWVEVPWVGECCAVISVSAGNVYGSV